jgi:hypothetical protein
MKSMLKNLLFLGALWIVASFALGFGIARVLKWLETDHDN